MGKHLNLSQRIIIESNLNENISLRKIGTMLGKPHTTVSREILTRRVLVRGNHFNNFNTKCDKTDKAPLYVMDVLIEINVERIVISIMLKMLIMIIVKL